MCAGVTACAGMTVCGDGLRRGDGVRGVTVWMVRCLVMAAAVGELLLLDGGMAMLPAPCGLDECERRGSAK